MSDSERQYIILGRISGLFGVKGWVKVYSHTEPREGIVDYDPWYLKRGTVWQPCKVAEGRRHGKGVVARLDGVDDRDAAAELIGSDIAVGREQLPALPAGEYYWHDLEGLRVRNLDGVDFGRVSHLFNTGVNDVLVVKGERERMIPFVTGEFVRNIDLESGEILVDWDADF